MIREKGNKAGELVIGGRAVSEEEFYRAFGDSLRAERKNKNLSLQELSEKTGLPFQTLSTYENCMRRPLLMQAVRIAAYFDTTVESFIEYGLKSR